MSDDSNNGVNDEAFEDSELSALYRETRIEQPSSKLDQTVLAMAKHHVQHQPHPVSPFSARWPITASMVAILVLGFGLVTLMKQELGPEQALQVSVPQKMTKPAKKKAKLKSDLLSPQSQSTSQSAPAESESAEDLVVPNAKPAAPSVIAQPALRSMPQTARQKEKTLPIPAPAMALSDSTAPPPQAGKKTQQAERLAEDTAQQKAPQAAFAKKTESAAAPLAKQEQVFGGAMQGIVSEEAGQSLEQMKPKGAQPVATVCRGSLTVISPQDYWRSYVAGKAQMVEKEGTSACVIIESQDKQIYYTIALTALQDRAIKQKVYTALVRDAIKALAVKKRSTAAEQDTMGKLQRLTGLNFTTLAQWQIWYAANRSTLVLSPDGKFLVSQAHK